MCRGERTPEEELLLRNLCFPCPTKAEGMEMSTPCIKSSGGKIGCNWTTWRA